MKLEILAEVELTGHTGSIYTLEAGPLEGMFYSAGSDGRIVLWDIKNSTTGKVIAIIPEHILCMVIDPHHENLFVGCLSGSLYKINLNSSSLPRLMHFHLKSIYQLKVCGDNVFAVSGDGILSVWNISEFKLVQSVKLSSVGLRSLHITSREKIYIGDQNGNLLALESALNFENNKFELITKLESNKTIFTITSNTIEETLWFGGLDAQIYKLEIKSDTKSIKAINAHWFTVNQLILDNSKGFIFSASRDKTIRIWDHRTMDLIKEISLPKFSGHKHSVNVLLWDSKSSLLLSAGDDHVIKSWKIEVIEN